MRQSAVKNLVRRTIRAQHELMPISFRAFDWIYASPNRRKRFGFYGREVFLSGYNHYRITNGNLDYWMSPESLYWHLWRQSEWNRGELSEIISRPDLRGLFDSPTGTAVELGFGIGKNYFAIRDRIRVKCYIGVEPNASCVQYAARKAAKLNDDRLQLVNSEAIAFLERPECQEFDLLLVFGGVLMYFSPDEIDRLFSAAKAKAVSSIVILNEGVSGSKEDWYRPDNTVMYNFERRLRDLGFSDRDFFHVMKDDGICSYFVMR